MRNHCVILAAALVGSGVFVSKTAIADQLDGVWTINKKWTELSDGSKHSISRNISLKGSSKGRVFSGKYTDNGKEIGKLKCKIKKPVGSYKQTLLIMERTDPNGYYAIYIGVLKGGGVKHGHWVDSFGNSGHFTMKKK